MIVEKDIERKEARRRADPRVDITFTPRKQVKEKTAAALEQIIIELEERFGEDAIVEKYQKYLEK